MEVFHFCRSRFEYFFTQNFDLFKTRHKSTPWGENKGRKIVRMTLIYAVLDLNISFTNFFLFSRNRILKYIPNLIILNTYLLKRSNNKIDFSTVNFTHSTLF